MRVRWRRWRVRRALGKALAEAEEREFHVRSDPLVIFSDHHKGTNDGADDFLRCERCYNAALAYYATLNYTLFVLGDAEELMACSAREAASYHRSTLELEAEFHKADRYERFWGNHDLVWGSPKKFAKFIGRQYFPGLSPREGLKLRILGRDEELGRDKELGTLFLVHGHQGTVFFHRTVSLVLRFGWRPMQNWIKFATTSPARDWKLRDSHDQILAEWAADQPDLVLIAGHTHRPVFWDREPTPDVAIREAEAQESLREATLIGGDEAVAQARALLEYVRAEIERVGAQVPDPPPTPCYFNTGCCSFSDGDITGLEIADEKIRLVRWSAKDGAPQREVLEHAEADLTEVFKAVKGGQ